ncbi:hypothetical protein [Pleionea sp. CnH1-48]|uniref:hypothetical protein n=1 Tax=Pleionea sp. CnH1-48 TaxID=2954494 RepID=UPI00209797C4|nr:hypothetical protein [Pleionea sp. CnH1-48]MCO7223700.1 hypothetical protein [Pleionea sp. CnH1-48]
MSRINKTGQINELIKALSSRSKETDSASTPNKSRAPTTTGGERLTSLKQDIIHSIASLDINEENDRESARKILISKMLQWQFKKLPLTASHIDYLVSNINSAIKKSESDEQKLNQLLHDLKK